MISILHWISIDYLSKLFKVSSLPTHHLGGPRTAGHFSNLENYFPRNRSWTWWGGWRPWPGRARGWGQRPWSCWKWWWRASSSLARMISFDWRASVMSVTYKPWLTIRQCLRISRVDYQLWRLTCRPPEFGFYEKSHSVYGLNRDKMEHSTNWIWDSPAPHAGKVYLSVQMSY